MRLYAVCHHRDIMLLLRATGRYILAALALLMLLQVAALVVKVDRTIASSKWSDGMILAVVACYIGWIAVTALGGLCGLYSSIYYDIPTAGWCLRSWWLLILFQLVEGAVLFGVLCEAPCSLDIWHTFGLDTLSLLITEGSFLVYIYLYMHILEACADAKLVDKHESHYADYGTTPTPPPLLLRSSSTTLLSTV
ncbi:hypothetical protein AC1031_016956 [Aphanomyces cochlioides]|nr:hypothetical protein AC1031_016956 [Aphanomyces cochlioides]